MFGLQNVSPKKCIKRRIGLASCALAALAVTLMLHPGKEPSYQGRSLSQWVALYGNYPGMKSPEEKQEPAEAIRQIGPNALPSLLTWISYEPPPWRKKAENLRFYMPTWLASTRLVKTLSDDEDYARAQNAMQAFKVLGTAAAPAIPELARRINTTKQGDARDRAIAALSTTGPSAVPVMASVLSNPADAKTMWVMFSVEAMGTNAQPLLPILLKNLHHPDTEVAGNSVYILGVLKLDPGRVVPALVACMADPRHDVRWAAPSALVRFGSLARPALPALTNALADPDPDMRKSAAEALEQLAPERLTATTTQ